MKFKYHNDGTLPPDQNIIWVFGSNLAGIHGAGAAKIAREYFGAQLGVGEGPYGNSYAIPTKDANIESRTLDEILTSVLEFVRYTRKNPGIKFWITAIGCGLAGFKHEEIAPMFKFCNPNNCSFPDAWAPHLEFSVGLDNIENIILDNQQSFEDTFCLGNELMSLSFNSSTCQIVYMTSGNHNGGQHIADSFYMKEFNAWMRSTL